MKAYSVALVAGDGVGPEVIAATRQVLECVELGSAFKLEFAEYLAGQRAYELCGKALPEETLTRVRQSDACLLGALASELVPGPSPTGQLRHELELYADVRRIKSYRGAWSLRPDINVVCIRENTEGFLADRNLHQGYGEFMPSPDMAISLRVVSRAGCERIARYAFELARAEGRKRVTAAHKANSLRVGCGLFLETVRRVAEGYKDIEFTDEYVDSVANGLITRPERYEVIVTTNLFGDILSDEAAALVSNLVPTANIGSKVAVFRPIHEAKLHEAGRDVANPFSAILCGGMMLRHLGQAEAARIVERAVEKVLEEGRARPRDMGGCSSLTEVTRAVSNQVRLLQ